MDINTATITETIISGGIISIASIGFASFLKISKISILFEELSKNFNKYSDETTTRMNDIDNRVRKLEINENRNV